MLATLPPDVTFVIAGGARRPVEERNVEYLRAYLRELDVEKRVVITDEDADRIGSDVIDIIGHARAPWRTSQSD